MDPMYGILFCLVTTTKSESIVTTPLISIDMVPVDEVNPASMAIPF